MPADNIASKEIADLQKRLADLDRERAEVLAALEQSEAAEAAKLQSTIAKGTGDIVRQAALSNSDNVALFRSLFKGREDIFLRRWKNSKTGRSGCAPACHNEWIRGICEKPRIKCSNCPNQAFVLVSEEIVRSHLQDRDVANSAKTEPFVAGIYPLMPDETCWFLAADFDKQSWQRDALAFLAMCGEKGVPAAIERSRSGNGAHIWIFFRNPCPHPRRASSAPIW
jgi:hypothetical protein